jgi:hypothetical protein
LYPLDALGSGGTWVSFVSWEPLHSLRSYGSFGSRGTVGAIDIDIVYGVGIVVDPVGLNDVPDQQSNDSSRGDHEQDGKENAEGDNA